MTGPFLNRAHDGLSTWFLEIALVHSSLCVCLSLATSGMILCDIDRV